MIMSRVQRSGWIKENLRSLGYCDRVYVDGEQRGDQQSEGEIRSCNLRYSSENWEVKVEQLVEK